MAFDVEFLNEIRAHELQQYLKYFPVGSRILELGGGTGMQAKILSEHGFDVETIDLSNSTYSDDLVYDVTPYDGHTIPFPDNSFDIVFSSNVLEHIPHITEFHSEMKRVLRPNGICVHVMPTGAWTFWTIVTHYINCLENVYGRVKHDKMQNNVATNKGSPSADEKSVSRLSLTGPVLVECWRVFKHTRKYMPESTFPNRHGEVGNVFTELWTFSRWWWVRHFKENEYHQVSVRSTRLFYTGYMFLGAKWSIASRNIWSRILGSACIIYIVKPK